MNNNNNKKIVYLSNGEEVELLTSFQDGKQTKYVVKVVIGEIVSPDMGTESIYKE